MNAPAVIPETLPSLIDRALPTDGWVYIIQSHQTGAIKIGFSADPIKRGKQLQTGSASRLALVAVIPGNRRLEAFLHREFSQHRIGGEWFSGDAFDHLWAFAQEYTAVVAHSLRLEGMECLAEAKRMDDLYSAITQ